jgi:hypothetical protein
MRHPFDGIVNSPQAPREDRRSVLRRAFAAVAAAIGLGSVGCGSSSPYTTPSMGNPPSTPGASTMALGEEGGYATTFAIGEEGGGTR